MILALQSARFCRKLSCLSTLKVLTVTYSASAPQQKEKPLIFKEPPCIAVGKKHKLRSIVIDSKTVIPPDIDYLNPDTTVDSQNQSKAIATKTWKWGKIEIDPTKLHKYCLMLSKIRLTSLVVITAMGGYAIAPAPFDLVTFLACSVGTGLVSAAANAVNQSMEVPYDAQMARTKNRVLVRGLLAPEHAIAFAAISGIAGVTLLATQVNTLTAVLGGANLILYTSIYTPMKRVSILNTWVGSVVGAIPPLMGWAGCVGSIAAPGAWIMSGMLYAWQFPHFNALSWNLRPDYSKAGYRMMAVSNPDLCRKTSFRYTVVLTALSYLAPALDVTNWWFAIASTPLNAYFLYLAWEFRQHGDARTSRRLFRFSLLHLPILMTLMLISKKYWFLNTDKKENSQLNDVTEKRQLIESISRILQPTSA
ncbi:protoheme IX farnesyltransferase, mitochondrial [Nasonia vitripennis]|uniref:Protoheme IX farnesyltransferase, mitochondrial n=1 Tax=Nasonia vitripennis TaxID=7425 RepID=A0A7M7LJV4_NASVI|nr:protoheme IX farnesyltransferase, mitochondrial [Nasonia vitripennis]XP_003424094.1 protoheme IX farnesyltransferase, mitochondrial [Nasonia vitripennis]XP_008212668.1 protoheme IX farnesyltransferase, mitochondrial [Nasonia vitripennis]XP_008212669.1 protoheme IX farnesyltransferase, mitochondrial [Nasonia vitripennis]